MTVRKIGRIGRGIIGVCLGLVFAATAAQAADDAVAGADVAAVVLNVADLDKSVAYYKMIGLQDKEHLGKAPDRRVQFNMDAPMAKFAGGLSLHEAHGPLNLGNGFIRFLVLVDDVKAACKRLADAKMPCAGEPRVVAGDGNAIIATAKDPDGYELQLIQPPRH